MKINQITGCTLHPSTVRRWLPAAELVWRRVAPMLRISDSNRAGQLCWQRRSKLFISLLIHLRASY